MGRCIYLRKGETHTKPVLSILAASLNIGDVVKLNEGGVMTEFIVVNQGLPDGSLYDISCNGTWLLRKDIKENRVWNSSDNNTYSTSTINTWLNGDYFNSLGSVEQGLVKQVKIPYVNGTGSGGEVASGASGLNVKTFLVGGYEVGIGGPSGIPRDGAKLSYFNQSTGADSKRIAYLNGSAISWWLRSPSTTVTNRTLTILTDGSYDRGYTSSSYGIRPALIIPFTAKFNSETKVLVGGGNSLPYLMFTASVPFSIATNTLEKYWNGTIYYSTDATNWTEWDGEPVESTGNRLYFRGIGNSVITGSTGSDQWIVSSNAKNVQCIGNIETLLDYQTVLAGGHPVMDTYCYNTMFQYWDNLVIAPKLPAMTLAQDCYSYMFNGCTSLIGIPALPATTLVDSCYNFMFDNCTKIKLSATKTGTYTQEYRIPVSGTGTTAFGALANMFTGTGGTFTGTPTINTTYYLDSSNYII